MGTYKEQGLAAKEVRLGIKDQRAVGGKSKRPRPFIVESRYVASKNGLEGLFEKDRLWRKWGAYRTFDEAQAAIEQLQRKYTFNEYRHKP